MHPPPLLTVLSLACLLGVATAFRANAGREIRFRRPSSALRAVEDADDGPDGDDGAQTRDDGGAMPPLAALPQIGASSFRDGAGDAFLARAAAKNADNEIAISERAHLVSRKFQIQYKCKVCGAQNQHAVTRLAYRQGLVIATCRGCESRHLLADNLGWCSTDFDNIEKFMDKRQEAAGGAVDDLVQRVSREVFELETTLHGGEGKNAAEEDNSHVEEESSWN